MKKKWVVTTVIIALVLILYSITSTPNCKDQHQSYQDGYIEGNTVRLVGGSSSCSEYISSYNDETGRNRKVSDCFCEGFDDAVSGRTAKY